MACIHPKMEIKRNKVAHINELEPMQRKKTRRQFLDNDIF